MLVFTLSIAAPLASEDDPEKESLVTKDVLPNNKKVNFKAMFKKPLGCPWKRWLHIQNGELGRGETVM